MVKFVGPWKELGSATKSLPKGLRMQSWQAKQTPHRKHGSTKAVSKYFSGAYTMEMRSSGGGGGGGDDDTP